MRAAEVLRGDSGGLARDRAREELPSEADAPSPPTARRNCLSIKAGVRSKGLRGGCEGFYVLLTAGSRASGQCQDGVPGGRGNGRARRPCLAVAAGRATSDGRRAKRSP